MAKHLSLRLAWHNEGWNGEACKEPQKNTYCVGRYSYPGEKIKENRVISETILDSTKCFTCEKKNGALPCAYSINAFGKNTISAHESPPSFFNGAADSMDIEVKPNTAFIWPYEQMYRSEVKADKNSGRQYDYDERLAYAEEFFDKLTPNSIHKKGSLIFYYANRSNPFSTDDNQVFVLVGVARLKEVGETLYYDNATEEIRKKYANGFIWQRPITSNYPDEGFKIPLQKYLDRPEIIEKILYVPEQNYNYKYAARHISDDDALIYVEKLLEIVRYLQSIGDKEENWIEREKWLLGVINELWKQRGPFPGLPSYLKAAEFETLIEYYKLKAENNEGKQARRDIFDYLNRKTKSLPDYKGKPIILKEYANKWRNHYSQNQKNFIENVLVRFDLTVEQMKRLLGDRKDQYSVTASVDEITENPYLLCEQYQGTDDSDEITFNKIDHGILPSPELGIDPLLPKNDEYRLRALAVRALQRETKHTFVLASEIIQSVNNTLSYFPEWKKTSFNLNYILNNRELMEEALYIKEHQNEHYLYLKEVWTDERLIERTVSDLYTRPEIKLIKPFTESKWKSILFDKESELANRANREYADAIQGQTDVCAEIFTKPISVVAGAAGTGKTTVIKAVITAIKNTSGDNESFCLLAPTGKAADRIREKTEQSASTIHSFLAKGGWLRENYTLKQKGGKRNTEYTTYIIDETSMLDLSLFAAFVRAVNWNYAKRLILVGDPNQLPPIGRGKVFDDIIKFLRKSDGSCLGILQDNLRQMLNTVTGEGNGILSLADMYVQENLKGEGSAVAKAKAEQTMLKIQNDEFDEDVEFIIWHDAEQLHTKITETIDSIKQSKEAIGEKFSINDTQILSPYRGEQFGTDQLNLIVQNHLNGYGLSKGVFGGIAIFDKVIQYRNRSNRSAYKSYNLVEGKEERTDIFNGEIGRVYYNAYHHKTYTGKFYNVRSRNKRSKRANGYQVSFQRKPKHRIFFNSDNYVEENLELAYAISVHKAQGSEFDTIFLIIPQSKQTLLSPELIYTGITRARTKLYVFIEKDYTPLLNLRRPERSHLQRINASTFEFKPLPQEWLNIEQQDWFKEGRIHSTLTEFMVRSKSEVIITNLLHQNEIDFEYEKRLQAKDGSYYLPDFTIKYRGKEYFWEHLGMLHDPKYKSHWETKEKWYDKFFPGQLLTTIDSGNLTTDAQEIIKEIKAN